MSFTNFDTKEINCKVLYWGPKGSGKTANLRSLLQKTSADVRTGVLELGESTGSTQFFDFLPISLGHVGEFHLKIHLVTLPQNSIYETLPTILARGVDGFVFVADSRIECLADNIDSLSALRHFLSEEGYTVADMPKVFQYNKRDLIGVVPVDILRQELNPAQEMDCEAVAVKHVGTTESLHAIAKQVMKRLAGQRSIL